MIRTMDLLEDRLADADAAVRCWIQVEADLVRRLDTVEERLRRANP